MKTAVEWLFENLIELNADMKYSIITWEEYLSKRAGLLDQAKAMEKEESESLEKIVEYLLINHRSIFLSIDISKEAKSKILNKLGYSSNILDEN